MLNVQNVDCIVVFTYRLVTAKNIRAVPCFKNNMGVSTSFEFQIKKASRYQVDIKLILYVHYRLCLYSTSWMRRISDIGTIPRAISCRRDFTSSSSTSARLLFCVPCVPVTRTSNTAKKRVMLTLIANNSWLVTSLIFQNRGTTRMQT